MKVGTLLCLKKAGGTQKKRKRGDEHRPLYRSEVFAYESGHTKVWKRENLIIMEDLLETTLSSHDLEGWRTELEKGRQGQIGRHVPLRHVIKKKKGGVQNRSRGVELYSENTPGPRRKGKVRREEEGNARHDYRIGPQTRRLEEEKNRSSLIRGGWGDRASFKVIKNCHLEKGDTNLG